MHQQLNVSDLRRSVIGLQKFCTMSDNTSRMQTLKWRNSLNHIQQAMAKKSLSKRGRRWSIALRKCNKSDEVMMVVISYMRATSTLYLSIASKHNFFCHKAVAGRIKLLDIGKQGVLVERNKFLQSSHLNRLSFPYPVLSNSWSMVQNHNHCKFWPSTVRILQQTTFKSTLWREWDELL